MAEETGIFTGSIPEQTYYQADDLSFAEFKRLNSGLGYPLRLPSVLDYETWKELEQPEDKEDCIISTSDPHTIER